MNNLHTICWYIIIYIRKDIRDNLIHFKLLISNTDQNIKNEIFKFEYFPQRIKSGNIST